MGKSTVSALCEKEVINTCDGRRLGCVCDVLVDTCEGRILAIMVPPPGGFGLFGKENPIVIPWEKICRLGDDIILVDIGQSPPCPKDKKKKFWHL
jgi:YlmC/YmxH family sporulation protein